VVDNEIPIRQLADGMTIQYNYVCCDTPPKSPDILEIHPLPRDFPIGVPSGIPGGIALGKKRALAHHLPFFTYDFSLFMQFISARML
jgi:hypothetical protein